MLALLWCRQVLYSLVYCKGHLTNSKTFRHEVINAGVTAYSSRWRGGQHLPPLQAQGLPYDMVLFSPPTPYGWQGCLPPGGLCLQGTLPHLRGKRPQDPPGDEQGRGSGHGGGGRIGQEGPLPAKHQNCQFWELKEELKRTEKNLKELKLSKY